MWKDYSQLLKLNGAGSVRQIEIHITERQYLILVILR
jgi:hypothetical protein